MGSSVASSRKGPEGSWGTGPESHRKLQERLHNPDLKVGKLARVQYLWYPLSGRDTAHAVAGSYCTVMVVVSPQKERANLELMERNPHSVHQWIMGPLGHHLWNMHTALAFHTDTGFTFKLELVDEGLWYCDNIRNGCTSEGAAYAMLNTYFSAGIDEKPHDSSSALDDILWYVDQVKNWGYNWDRWNCQLFAGELYANIVRGKRNVYAWSDSKYFIDGAIEERWRDTASKTSLWGGQSTRMSL